MKTIYKYHNIEYTSERKVRQAIWYKERKALPKITTAEGWAKYGVEYIVTPTPQPTLEELKVRKQTQLESAYNAYREASSTYLTSSLGFRVNSNITAFNNVIGLIAKAEKEIADGNENPTFQFRDFDNQFQTVDLNALKTIQVEISDNGSASYLQKWNYEQQINACEDKESLDKIEIVFTPVDFSVKETE